MKVVASKTDESNSGADAYQSPALIEFGTIEEWTRGSVRNQILVSIVV